MSYEEWLSTIEKIKRTKNNKNLLEKLKSEEINPNINELLLPKIEDLIVTKFTNAVNGIKNDLESAFSDENYLDYVLVNFKNDINYVMELIKLKQVPADRKVMLTYKVVEGIRETYDILLREAEKVDATGVLYMMIKNDRIKWSE